MKTVGIIGAGIFGASCALALGRNFKVTLFEEKSSILSGASYGNQNRFHYGYHYPRSLTTGRECLEAIPSFKANYGDSLLSDLENYYCVSAHGSKVSKSQYLDFCRTLGVPCEESPPPAEFLAAEKISLAIRVPEPIFDQSRLREIISSKLADSQLIDLRCDSRVIMGGILGNGKKVLTVDEKGASVKHEFDYVVSAGYSKLNELSEWLGFPKREFQYELVEIPVIDLPTRKRVGLTIMDGDFCSILPLGATRKTLLYHASECVLERKRSKDPPFDTCFDTNWEGIMAESEKFLPIVGKAEYSHSITVMRVVDPDSERDDSRRSEIIDQGDGCWSVFSGKVVTACAIGESLAARILNEDTIPSNVSRATLR